MTAPLQVRRLRIHRLAVPLRPSFQPPDAREAADPVVVELTAGAPYAHHVGYGETLARARVTGETAESVTDDVAQVLAARLSGFRPESFVAALEFIDTLPVQVGGRVITAARTAVELALLDLACRAFGRRPADVAGWMGLPGFGPPGCLATVRFSGVVAGRTRGRLRNLLRLQRLYGLRDFKIDLAADDWQQRLEWTHQVLGRAIRRKHVSLRADANAGWSLLEANEALGVLERFGVCALEQPLSDAEDADLPYLSEQTHCDLIADESLLTVEDAQRLIAGGGVRVLSVRLSKNGGLLPALRIARLALAGGLDVQLGGLAGETSILSAAGLAFLEACPKVRFAEGALGGFALRDDVTDRRLRFGFRGRVQPRRGVGWGVNVDSGALTRLAQGRARTLHI
jgi:L-alanine-DL-glutamate epimerase-like enolase superfamily enzyme